MEITVGKYVKNNSIIHSTDPRIKIFSNILLIALLFVSTNFISYAIVFALVLFAYLLSKLSIKKLFAMLKPVLLIGFFVFLINIFVIDPKPSEEIWFKTIRWWKIKISGQAINTTMTLSMRIYLMIIITTIITSTTKPVELTKGLEDLMMPLKLFRIPVHIIAMIISISLRFIPTLLDESQRIMKAQASRGVDFKNGGIKAKAKSTVTLIVPLFVISFSKADDLGNALETRGYDPYAKRTRYRSYSIKSNDIIMLALSFALMITIIYISKGIIHLPNLYPHYSAIKF